MLILIQRNGIKIKIFKLDFVSYCLIPSSLSHGNIDLKHCLHKSATILFFKSLIMQTMHSVSKIRDWTLWELLKYKTSCHLSQIYLTINVYKKSNFKIFRSLLQSGMPLRSNFFKQLFKKSVLIPKHLRRFYVCFLFTGIISLTYLISL